MAMTPNPYNPLQPSGDPAVFFGHTGAFAFFRQHFVGSPLDRPLVLIGRRGLGKSAVLQQLPYQLEERYRPCIVPLGAVDHLDETALFTALVDAIRQTLEDSEASTYRLPDWPGPDDLEAHFSLRDWFRDEYLDVALAALRIRHLILAFDDAHLLLDAIARGDILADWLAYLGDVLAHYERLDAVFTLDAGYEDQIPTLPLLNDPALHIRLGELAAGDAERLIREPVQGIYDYQPDVVVEILALAGGHPFLLQAICFLLFRRSEERKHAGPIIPNDLESIHPAVMDQADVIFDPLWQQSTPNERRTLTALVRLSRLDLAADVDDSTPAAPDDDAPGTVHYAAIMGWLTGAGYALNKTQLAAALRSLGYMGLVRVQADTYRLSGRLIADWVQGNDALPAAAAPELERRTVARLAPFAGVLAIIVVIVLIEMGLRSGVLSGYNEKDAPVDDQGPVNTLSVDIEGTRQSDIATQTEIARPTETLTPTNTRRPTRTPTPTNTPTLTPAPTETLVPTATHTPPFTDTPPPTDTPRPTRTPRISATPTPLPTLDPGS